jgi:N6-adenosine-specific RNA methylase IME4
VKLHPLAEIFPLIEGPQFADLVADLRANGLREPIVTLDGAILDGRNRYRACLEAEVEPRFARHDGSDPVAFVVSMNIRRRHLDESQRGMASARLANMPHGGAIYRSANLRIDQEADLPGYRSANLQIYPAAPPDDDDLSDFPWSEEEINAAAERYAAEEEARLAALESQSLDEGDLEPAPQETVATAAPAPPPVSIAQAAALLNVSQRTAENARAVIKHGTPELIAAVDRGEIKASVGARLAKRPEETQRRAAKNPARAPHIAKQEARAEREIELAARQTALPQKRYGAILADPEWRFEPWSRETGMDRAPDNHYPTSELTDIKARDVASIAADDCVLFLWATAPMLPQALDVMRAWGFAYKSQAIWVKDRTGTGYWFRNRHEHLLVGTKGNLPAPAPGTQWESVIHAELGEHSEKPVTVYGLIESYFPNLPKIELNARAKREGWDAWGLEAPDPMTPA